MSVQSILEIEPSFIETGPLLTHLGTHVFTKFRGFFYKTPQLENENVIFSCSCFWQVFEENQLLDLVSMKK